MGFKIETRGSTPSRKGKISLPVGSLQEASRFHPPLGASHCSSQDSGAVNFASWNLSTPLPHEHPFLEYSGAPLLSTWGLNRHQFPPLNPKVHHCKGKSVKNTLDIKTTLQSNKFRGTYVDALVKESFLTPNLGGGLMLTAPPLVFLASPTLELLAGRVVLVPFDRSAVVEGTVCPTTASSPDVVVHGILAAEKMENKIKKSKSTNLKQSTRLQPTSYLPVAGSL